MNVLFEKVEMFIGDSFGSLDSVLSEEERRSVIVVLDFEGEIEKSIDHKIIQEVVLNDKYLLVYV